MNVGLGLDVDADGGLVDDQDLDARGEPFGDADLLLVAAGKIADHLGERRRADFQFSDDGRDMRAHRFVAQEAEPAGELAPDRDPGILEHGMGEDQALLLAILADVADAAAMDGVGDAGDTLGPARDLDLRRRSADRGPERILRAPSARRRRGRRGRRSRPCARVRSMFAGRARSRRLSGPASSARRDRVGAQSGICSLRPIIRRTSLGAPRPAIGRLGQALRPSRKTVTSSQICCTSSSLWLTNKARRPRPGASAGGERDLGLLRRQRGRRFVEKQHARAQRQRLGDLDKLHLRDVELRDRRRGSRSSSSTSSQRRASAWTAS